MTSFHGRPAKLPPWLLALLLAVMLAGLCNPARAAYYLQIKGKQPAVVTCATWDDLLKNLERQRLMGKVLDAAVECIWGDDDEGGWRETDEDLRRLLDAGVTYNLVRHTGDFSAALRAQLFLHAVVRRGQQEGVDHRLLLAHMEKQRPGVLKQFDAGFRIAKANGLRPSRLPPTTNGFDPMAIFAWFNAPTVTPLPHMFAGARQLTRLDPPTSADEPLVHIDNPVDSNLLHQLQHGFAPQAPQLDPWQAGAFLHEHALRLAQDSWPGAGDPFAESQYGAPRVLWTLPLVRMPWWKRSVQFVLRSIRP
jgi:hypothetical protein